PEPETHNAATKAFRCRHRRKYPAPPPSHDVPSDDLGSRCALPTRREACCRVPAGHPTETEPTTPTTTPTPDAEPALAAEQAYLAAAPADPAAMRDAPLALAARGGAAVSE